MGVPRLVGVLVFAALLAGLTRDAVAGMPSPVLNDLARLRFEAISFFGVVFLGATWGFQAIWNGLRADFGWLPRLSYRRALGLVTIWGLVFVLVLTMISGARELMTPGAWRKVGLTYKLADGLQEPILPADPMPARRAAIERLRQALWQYAGDHAGAFPASRAAAGFAASVWVAPGLAGQQYLYLPGRRVNEGSAPVAFEPGLFGPGRLVLLSDGSVREWDLAAIERANREERTR